MAFGKTAGCLILAGGFLASPAIASAAQFPVRHEHWRGHCDGVLTVDEKGVSFQGEKKHAWSWQYRDIQQLTLSPDLVLVVTYQDNKLLLGADRSYRFTGKVPAVELYALLKDRLDQRFVAALDREADPDASLPAWNFPVKHLGRIAGSEGTLTFDSNAVIYSTPANDDSRTWRYGDIDNISSSGPFQLTVTTVERDRYAPGGRKAFDFQLKERIDEATYNAIWLQIQQKTGKIELPPAERVEH
jgi:hypothetical protein